MAKYCEICKIFLPEIVGMKLRLLFLLCTSMFWAQNTKVLNGKVMADSKALKDINVINLQSHKEAVTDKSGSFTISAKAGDTLSLTSIQLQPKKIVVEKEDFDYMPFLIKMQAQVTLLKEVVVEQSDIDAVSLGIVPYKVRIYTPAERKYYTATTGSGLVSVDAIINAISGKTKELKKNIVIEGIQKVQSKLLAMFDESYFINELKIPSDYVNGFVVYAAENDKITNAVSTKNKTLVKFLLGELAVDYNKMIKNEK